jgi:hypothetical protein
MKFKQEVAAYREEMERLRRCNDSVNSERYKEVQERHARILIQEETYWRQRAGKKVMIKSVLQAIPSYVVSIYLLPADSTIKEIKRMINSFWWGGGVNNKGIKWLAWDHMTF